MPVGLYMYFSKKETAETRHIAVPPPEGLTIVPFVGCYFSSMRANFVMITFCSASFQSTFAPILSEIKRTGV